MWFHIQKDVIGHTKHFNKAFMKTILTKTQNKKTKTKQNKNKNKTKQKQNNIYTP